MVSQEMSENLWGELLTAETIGGVEPACGFPSNSTGKRFRPFGFSWAGDANVVVEALNAAGQYSLVDVNLIPGVTLVDPQYAAGVTSAPVASLRYTQYPVDSHVPDTGEPVPLLAFNPERIEEDKLPRAHFVLGEHPNKGRAIYIGAVLLGHMPSAHFMPHFYPAKKRRLHYYPLPTAPLAAAANPAPEYSI